MLADVAEAGGAEQGVGDRVKHDVGIAVAGEAAVVRDLDAAEHDRAFAGEGVDVEAHAGARDEPRRRAIARRARSRRAVVSFSSAGSPSTAATFMPAARSDRRFVGRRAARPALIGRRERVEAERLRRLDADQAGRGRPARPSVVAARASVSPTGKHRRGAVEELEAGEQPVDDRRRAEGPGGVVDQHGVAVDRGEAGADANPRARRRLR